MSKRTSPTCTEEFLQLMKTDFVLDPTKDDVYSIVMDNTSGTGVDVVLEMAGRTEAIRTGFKILRLGGRMSLLGIPPAPSNSISQKK